VEIAPARLGAPVAVNPGKRQVSAKSTDGSEAKGEIELAEREVREIELTLSAKGDAAKPAVTTTVSPSTSGTSPPAKGDPVVVSPSTTASDSTNRPRTPLALGLMYGGGATAAVGLTVGIITGAMTLSKAHTVEPQCENNICAPEAKDDLNSALTLGTVSTVSFVIGVVGAAAGVVGFLLPRRPEHVAGRGFFRTFAVGPTGAFGTFQ
jgi:hypothetical protein